MYIILQKGLIEATGHHFLQPWEALAKLEESGMFLQLCYRAFALALPSLIHASQPSVSPPVGAPLRDLPWGQLNFLHTTDTHGWHAGHLQEYSVLLCMNHRPWLTGNEDPFTALTGVTTSPLRNTYEPRQTRKELIFYSWILEIE